jgi:hypothetical protein
MSVVEGVTEKWMRFLESFGHVDGRGDAEAGVHEMRRVRPVSGSPV